MSGSIAVRERAPLRRRRARAGVASVRRLREPEELLRRYAAERSPEDREQLVLRFMPLARNLAGRFVRGGEPRGDLEQVAIGLLKAIDRFDPGRGSSFVTFALPTIVGELQRHYRDNTWSIHLPRGMKEAIAGLRDAEDALTGKLGRSPTAAEMAEAMDCPLDTIIDIRVARSATWPRSLDESDTDEEFGPTLGDRIGRCDPYLMRADDAIDLGRTLRALPRRDRSILLLYAVHDLTQSAIAARVGLSQVQVGRIIRRSVGRLRAAAGSAP